MIDEARQRTPEWFEARLGNVTASAVRRIGRRKDGTWTADAVTYAHELVGERLTGIHAYYYESEDMRWGTRYEAAAIAALGVELGAVIWASAYVPHPTIDRFGASPDGTMSAAVVEVKCPRSATHVSYRCERSIPDEYMDQAASQLAACPAAVEHIFASYDPRMPEALRLLVVRTPRAALEAKIAEVEKRVGDFLSFVAEIEGKARS